MASKRGIIRPFHSTLVLIQRLSDVLLIGLAQCLAMMIYFGRLEWSEPNTLATGVAALTFLFCAEAAGLYEGFRGVPVRDELLRIWIAWSVVAAVLLFGAFVSKESTNFSRGMVLIWFFIAPTVITLLRIIRRTILREARKRGRNTRKVAILGLTDIGEKVGRRIQESPWLGMELVGFFEDRDEERCHRISESIGILSGNFDAAVELAKSGDIDLLYLALPLRAEPRVKSILRKLADTTASVYVVPDFFVFDLLHGRWTSLGELPVVSVFETPFHGIDGWLKRIEDIILGTIFVTIGAIPMLFIAIGIKLTSKGPVFFRQRRYGLNGEVIDVLKFRSMTVAEDGDKVTQATKGDMRITKFGGFLRRASLDELPQLFHVVTGSMSLVGPRPHAVAHNEAYRQRIHGYMLRHKVKPGLTGWAQVNGWRGETDTLEKMERRIEHDLDYIRRWNLLFDLKIVFLTFVSPKVHRNAR
ncbi:MAG: undecaprenyl-phosphate glucose phosphotransferase [Polyangiales bacterium]